MNRAKNLCKFYGCIEVVLVVKKLPANVGDIRDMGSIPGSGRSPGGGHGNLSSLPGGSDGKESACNVADLVLILGWEDPLEKGMATHSTILAWENSTDRGAWWTTVYGVTKSWT